MACLPTEYQALLLASPTDRPQEFGAASVCLGRSDMATSDLPGFFEGTQGRDCLRKSMRRSTRRISHQATELLL